MIQWLPNRIYVPQRFLFGVFAVPKGAVLPASDILWGERGWVARTVPLV